MHDVSHNVIPPNVSNLFTYSSKVHHHNTRFSASGNFYIKCSRTDHMKNSFSRISAKLWNSIPVSCFEFMLAMIWSGPITDPSCRLYIIKKGNKRHESLRVLKQWWSTSWNPWWQRLEPSQHLKPSHRLEPSQRLKLLQHLKPSLFWLLLPSESCKQQG